MHLVSPIVFALLFLQQLSSPAQLKFLIEDFEGFSNGISDLHKNGVFDYGNIKAEVQKVKSNKEPFYIEDRCIAIKKEGKQDHGGWGKGISLNVELDPSKDYLNFYLRSASAFSFKVTLQEDDD